VEDGDLWVLRQSIPDGPFYAVAWNPSGPEFFLAVETATSAAEALDQAKATWQQAAAAGFDTLHGEHVRAWQKFWAGSAVYLPERRMEFLWYYGLYLLASASRRGSLPPGLQGLWAMDGVIPPWRGDYHADMNVQETFWPAYASGHLELADSWCDLMRDSLPTAQEFTRRFFGTEGTFWLCCTLPQYTPVPCWHTVQFGWSHSGWLGWLVWLRWRYSLDREWLAATGYPVIAEIFKFFRANLVEEEDGHLHVPLSSSPEYRENKPAAWCQDPNVDLALIRRCCDWVVEMEQALRREDLSPAAREVRARLVPYHLTAGKALCLWAGKPLDESHRHPSHLMAIHPAMDLTVEDDEDTRRIIEASLEQYFALGQYQWAGHTYAQMASFAAVLGRAGFAYDCLLHFWEYWIGPNGLHFNRDTRNTGITCYRGTDRPFTLEASCAISAGISDLLVQGWRDVVRVFPAVPDHWRDAAFRDLLTEGAFRVSALRRDSRTVWVKVVASVARTLRLRNPFGDAPIEVEGGTLRREGDLLVGDLYPGQEITLWRAGESVDFEDDAMLARQGDVTRLGLR
jgi:alpha-L-fucosidase 2